MEMVGKYARFIEMVGKYSRFIVVASLSLLALGLLSRCADPGREIIWNEVVEASTGERFTAKRKEVRRSVAEPFQSAGWLFQQSAIEANVPGIGLVTWETSLRPWLLDRANDGRWYFIAIKGSYGSDSEYGLFDGRGYGPWFVIYRHRAGEWERILDKDVPPQFTKPNLLLNGSAIFEVDLTSPYWDDNPPRAQSRFRNGDLLSLELKRKVNVSSNDNLSIALFDLSQARLKLPWMVDHGYRNLTECTTGGRCNDECWRSGASCRSVQKFDIGQSLGRPPVSLGPPK